MKYENNEEYQDWSTRAQRFKGDLDKGLKRGLPKLFYYEEDLSAIANDHSRISKLRDFISDRYQEFKVQNIEPSGEDEDSFDFGSFFED